LQTGESFALILWALGRVAGLPFPAALWQLEEQFAACCLPCAEPPAPRTEYMGSSGSSEALGRQLAPPQAPPAAAAGIAPASPHCRGVCVLKRPACQGRVWGLVVLIGCGAL
jgi:hypothetical protein